MTAFSDAAPLPPPGFVLVPPTAFKSDWEDRPREEQCVGIRMVSFQDVQVARAQARERANQAIPNADVSSPHDVQAFMDAHNDALMAHIASQCMCDANDVTSVWEPIKAAPEDMVREFMTSDGLKLVFDAWERMRLSLDPTQREAEDEEIATLPALLTERGPHLSLVRRARIRRLLAFVLDELARKP